MDMNRDDIRQYDRRKHARVVKDIYTVYAMSEPFQEGLFMTENVSGSGMLFKTQDPMQIGISMMLNIHLPDRINPIPCEARVVRADLMNHEENTFEVGLAFTKIADSDKKELVSNLLTQDDFYLFL